MSRAEEIWSSAGRPFGLTKLDCDHAETTRVVVHLVGEVLDRAGDAFGEHDRHVVRRFHHQHLERVVDGDHGAGREAHLHRGLCRRVGRDDERRSRVMPAFLDRAQRHVGGHELGDRGGIPGLAGILGEQHLAAVGFDHQQRFGRRAARRRARVAAQATPAHIRVRATKDRVDGITAPGPVVWRASGTLHWQTRVCLGRGWMQGKSEKPQIAPPMPTARCSWSKKASKIRQVSVGSAQVSRFDHGPPGIARWTEMRGERRDRLHRWLGPYAVRPARGRDGREPDRAGRDGGARRCRGRRRRCRRDRARAFQRRLLGAGFHRLAGAAGLARSALQAREPGRERLRHRLGRGASGPQGDRRRRPRASCWWSASSR